MKKIIAICLLCSGCYSGIDSWKINMAQVKCQEDGGIDYISLVNHEVFCANGNIYTVMPLVKD